MKCRQPTITILMADDDEDDNLLMREALTECELSIELYIVSNGEELMDYLLNRGSYTDSNTTPRPGLIVLDLNMPKKGGIEALKEIKTHPKLKQIPVVVWTTSNSEEDIYNTYSLGANSFIIKPINFTSLVEIVKILGKYWFDIVKLPI